MHYFDTSFLVPLILEEATSAEVDRFIRDLPVGQLAISHWTRVEFSSLLAREVRSGGLEPETAAKADAEFAAVVEETFIVWLPDSEDSNSPELSSANMPAGYERGAPCTW